MWPDYVRQSRSIDEFLWKGDRRAKPIQRAALVLYSLMFLLMAFVGSVVAWKLDDGWLMRAIFIVLACLFAGVSVRLMRNAFRR
ncbi:MAG TPA: hypothetical protein VL135_13265 [Terracidiphilus sp.]|jgi:hypothetical protein|nr:hypothetical protein [Terracidiphilus sp.]